MLEQFQNNNTSMEYLLGEDGPLKTTTKQWYSVFKSFLPFSVG